MSLLINEFDLLLMQVYKYYNEFDGETAIDFYSIFKRGRRIYAFLILNSDKYEN